MGKSPESVQDNRTISPQTANALLFDIEKIFFLLTSARIQEAFCRKQPNMNRVKMSVMFAPRRRR
jgi:hypothetical protein